MKQILLKFGLILDIKTRGKSPTTFDKNEVRGEILRVKLLGKHGYMKLREKTKYVLGLPGSTQIGLEHGQK